MESSEDMVGIAPLLPENLDVRMLLVLPMCYTMSISTLPLDRIRGDGHFKPPCPKRGVEACSRLDRDIEREELWRALGALRVDAAKRFGKKQSDLSHDLVRHTLPVFAPNPP